MKELDRIALEVRKKLLQNIVKAGGGHTGGSIVLGGYPGGPLFRRDEY